jgi:response regulator NasT
VGIAMHRFSLDRHQALERLRRQAMHDGLSLDEQASRFVAALETLSAPGA